MPTDPILGVITAVVVVSLLGSVAVAFTGTDGLDAVIGLQAALEIGLVLTAFAFAALRGVRGDVMSALGLRAPGPGAWSAAAKTFGLYLLGAFVYGLVVGPPEQRDLADELGFNTGVAGAIIAGLAIVVVAPFAEETFFRGFLFGSLRDLTSVWPAALGSGFFFGIIHLSTGDLSVVPPLAYLGVLLALLYARTGSIWPPIAVHTFNNALAFTLLVST
jgi:membrane protease YdiL (CAAX protease family)